MPQNKIFLRKSLEIIAELQTSRENIKFGRIKICQSTRVA
jgi:hypothetical protein